MTVELPKDAEGREIPLDTECLYTCNGEKQEVISFTYYRREDRWEVGTDTHIVNSINLYITPPDSWEKLEEDLGKIANNPGEIVCAYFNRERKDCDGCRIENCEGSCSYACLEDIMTRIHELRGED